MSETHPPHPATAPFFEAGFRPFFLGAAVWAAVSMVIWLLVLAGAVQLADPFAWHTHALLFGYLPAAMAGFLLTAAPSWTRQPALSGGGLAVLWGLWCAARVATLGLGALPTLPLALLDLSMPVALLVLTTRQVLAAKNWRNLSVLGTLAAFILGDILYLRDVALANPAAQGAGARLGLAAALVLISVVGGRIAPNFTRNWLKRRDQSPLPAEAGPFDIACHVVLAASLLVWVVAPGPLAGPVLILAGGVHLWRMRNWQSFRTLSDPLLWVLHAGYAFVPLGALGLGAALLFPDIFAPSAALHLWTVGAVGVTTLAVMPRATLAHSGGPLVGRPGSALLFGALIAAALVRAAAGLVPALAVPSQHLAALCWILAFGGFAVIYRDRLVGAGAN